MAALKARVDFASLTDARIAEIGLDQAATAFVADFHYGLTDGGDIAIVVGVVDNDEWQEQGQRLIGKNAETFLPNIDPVIGKLATALKYKTDSIDAYYEVGDQLPDGAQRYTGAVYYVARVKTLAGWMMRVFVGAASGVQGHLDMATVYSAVTRMGACWALKMQAQHGKAA